MSVRMQLARLEVKVERRPARYVLVTTVLFAGCFGPWLLIHFGHLWTREHYQFFPMMLLAVAVLTYDSWKTAASYGLSFQTLRLSTPLFVLSALTFSGALWLHSPWLAFLTTIVILWAILRNLPFGCSSIAPLFVLLPLPFTMDGELVHGLQRVSSRGASAMLDLASIQHLMSGNVLEVSDKSFFVEEACSGIGSVYLMLASAAVYASWRKLRLVVAIPLLLSAVFWAVAGNTFRIFSVAWSHENLQLDLSSGSLHDTLGTGTYVTSLLLLMMTEQALLFVFEPIEAPELSNASDTKAQTMAATIGRFWDQRTLMDPQMRIRKSLAKGIGGFKVNRGKFIIVLMILLSFGCCGNIWRFLPNMLEAIRPAAVNPAAVASEGVLGTLAASPNVHRSFLSLPMEIFSCLRVTESPVPQVVEGSV